MSERLQPLDYPTAVAEADREEGNGRMRARCLADRLAASGKLWVSRLDREEFMDLAWQEDDNTRHLTASLPSRTLAAVAERILIDFGSFEGLLAADPIPGHLNPEWFRKCAELSREFDWQKWTKPWLVPAQANELRGSPRTTLYVCEGVHRTIVVAVALLSGSIDWAPMDAIEAEERLDGCC
jgi:hypothetical protein